MNESAHKSEWYKILYVEAWKQYIHEETLSHSKNTFFLSAHAVLIALLTGITSVLTKFGVMLGPFLFGVISILMSIIGLLISNAWKKVNAAHRGHIHMRWITAKAIESDLNLERIGLASLEHSWRNESDKKGKFYPFKDEPKLKDLNVFLLGKLSGYHSINAVISWLKVIWLIILILGTTALVLGIMALSERFPSVIAFLKSLI